MDRLRVLALDDDPDTLELIRMTLKDEFEILTLSNPMETYEYLELFEPDLLVLDIMMPKITGFQIIELMSKNISFRHIPIIVLSAKDSVREIKYGYKLGVRLYLTKPFQPERLLKNVKMIIAEITVKKHKSLTLAQALTQIQIKQSYKSGLTSVSSEHLTAAPSNLNVSSQTPMPKIPKMSYNVDNLKQQIASSKQNTPLPADVYEQQPQNSAAPAGNKEAKEETPEETQERTNWVD